MILHTREMRYSEDYEVLFDALQRAARYVNGKYENVRAHVLYNLAGERGRVIVQTTYPSLAEYERIDTELDSDEEYTKLVGEAMGSIQPPIVDQFYRIVD